MPAPKIAPKQIGMDVVIDYCCRFGSWKPLTGEKPTRETFPRFFELTNIYLALSDLVFRKYKQKGQ